MSDTLNALQAANRSASVLQGIANPPQFNPLAAITAGNQAAEQSFRTDQAQMQTGAMRSAMVASQAMTVARDGSDANLAASFANLRASGAFPPQLVDQEYARWKAMSPPERQDNAVRIGLVHLDQLNRVLGATTMQDIGGRKVAATLTQPTPTSPAGSLVVGGGGFDTGMSPAERGQIVTWNDPDGTPHVGTVEEAHKAMGISTPSGPAVSGSGAAPSVTPPPPPAGSKARTSSNTTVPPPPPDILKGPITPDAAGDAAPPKKGGASITGAAPGVPEAAKLSAEDSAKAGAALVARGDQAPSAKANYANMMSDLDRLGRMPPGGAKQIAIETFLKKATGYGVTMTADQVAAANSFSKLANIAVGQQLAAIGGTDARQNLFMGSSPNLDLSKLGNQQIIHMLQGNEDAIQAKSRAWNDWANEHGTHTYRQFQNDWNHHFDPRVFQQQYYKPDEVEALKKSLAREGKGATAKFWEDVDYAKANKMIP